jgi:hypothetical protein
MFLPDLRLTKRLKVMFGSRYSAPRIPNLDLQARLDRHPSCPAREVRYTFRPDLLSEHCFGSVSQTFLQNLTWSFGCSDVSGVIKI